MPTITGITCSKCNDDIYSMSRHDFVWCSCRETFVDGGAAYLRVGGYPVMNGDKIAVVKKESDVSQKESAW